MGAPAMLARHGVSTVCTSVGLPALAHDQFDALSLATRNSREVPWRLGGVVHPSSI